MKILILTNYANGLYLFRKEVIMEFLEQGYETVVSLPPDEHCKKIEDLGCRVIPTELERRGINPLKDFKLFLNYCKILKKERPDVVLTYTIKPNLYGGLACRCKKVPYIMNITGLGTALEKEGTLAKILLAFYRFVSSGAACVFFQNMGNKQFMQERGIALQNAHMLPGSGINLSEHVYEPYPEEEDGISFLAVIRVMKDKGIEELLEAAACIKKKHEKVKFKLAGEFEEETRSLYEPQIRKLEAEGVLKYLGHIDNVHKEMAESHVIVHPSYHEGLSNVLLEAAACGRPVLASDVYGCRETMIPGVSGITFKSRDSKALENAMDTILSYSGEERARMGAQGRSHVEAVFDRNIVIKDYLVEIRKTI